MAGPADDSDRIMREAEGALVRRQRAGRLGHRDRRGSIGRGSARLRSRHRRSKALRIIVAILLINVVASGTGLAANGIGLDGLFITILAIVAVAFMLARYPRLKVPERGELNRGDARSLVARTELWLEAQRPALPAPAVALVDQMGVQLDAIGLQLEGVEPTHPAAQEVRSLIGEHLPALVDSYRRIPAHIRSEDRGGRTADQQLADGLAKISGELDQVTRQLAAGDLDNLAIRGRYLDYRYGGELEQGSTS
jgi:hypothetical protein